MKKERPRNTGVSRWLAHSATPPARAGTCLTPGRRHAGFSGHRVLSTALEPVAGKKDALLILCPRLRVRRGPLRHLQHSGSLGPLQRQDCERWEGTPAVSTCSPPTRQGEGVPRMFL